MLARQNHGAGHTKAEGREAGAQIRAQAERVTPSHRHALESVLAALAHDIRTPLTGILALSELLAASDLPERERGWAQAIKSAADHLAQQTTLVLDAVKADRAGLALRKDVFSPRNLRSGCGLALGARGDERSDRGDRDRRRSPGGKPSAIRCGCARRWKT